MPTTTPETRQRAANLLAKVLHPAVTVPASVLGLSIHGASGQWGYVALAVLMCAVVPVGFMFALARVGAIESVDARPHRQRLLTLIGLVALEVVGVAVLWASGAPPLLVGLIASCLAGIAAMGAATALGVRASIHVASLSTVAGVVVGRSAVIAGVLLVLAVIVGSARLVQREHTPVEAVTGLVGGFAVGALASWALVS